MVMNEKQREMFNKANTICSRCRMKITCLKKTDNSEQGLQVISNKWVNIKGKELKDSLLEDYQKGIFHTIEIVDAEPKKFQFNTLYILRNGKVCWVYVEENSEEEDSNGD